MPRPPLIDYENLNIQGWTPARTDGPEELWHWPDHIATGYHWMFDGKGLGRQISLPGHNRFAQCFENGLERPLFYA